MNDNRTPFPEATLRRAALRLIVALALATPAAAVAAEPLAKPDAEPAAESGPQEEILERIDTPLDPPREDLRAERRKRRAAQGPFHPVAGSVSYGDAQAAFGDARGRPHEGQDIFAPAGTPVLAPVDGVVVEAGSDGGRGNWLSIYDAKRKQSYSYFHLLGAPPVGAGEKVSAGQKIGQVGCTGSCFGDHLHFEVRAGRGPYGAASDPMALLGDWKPFKG